MTCDCALQLPGYQLLNFLLCSLAYIMVSHRLFNLTNALKNAFVPHSDNAALAANAVIMLASAVLVYSAAGAVHLFLFP